MSKKNFNLCNKINIKFNFSSYCFYELVNNAGSNNTVDNFFARKFSFIRYKWY